MEAKQISLFCLLLAALAGKIETKPSGSLNALSAEKQTLQSAEQDIVSLETTSVSLGSAGSFGTGTGGVGTLHRGYPNGVTALDGLNNGFTGFGLNRIHGQSGFFGQGLESYGNFGQDIIDCQGLGGSGGNCQQRTGRIGIPGDCGCGSYQQNLPLTSLSSFGQQQNLPFTSLGCLGQQQNLPFTSLGCLGQQQYGSLSNFNPCGTAGSQGGLSCLSLPYTSCSQVGSQDLGYVYPCGCQGSFDDISFDSNYGLRQSLPSYSADFSCLGNTQLQGISDYGGYGAYQQGITGCTGCSPSLQEADCNVETACTESLVADCGPVCSTTC